MQLEKRINVRFIIHKQGNKIKSPFRITLLSRLPHLPSPGLGFRAAGPACFGTVFTLFSRCLNGVKTE